MLDSDFHTRFVICHGSAAAVENTSPARRISDRLIATFDLRARVSFWPDGSERIPKPIRLDHHHTINPYAEFEQPSFCHFYLNIILFL